MNVDWVSIAVIASVVAMIIGAGWFINYAIKHINQDHSSDD